MGGRVSLWRHTLTVFFDYPLLGGGSNTLFYPLLGSDAHNTFLSVLAETGLIGFLSFMSIVAVVFYQAVKLAQSQTPVWLTVFFTWAIGASMLSWEFRKPTWLFMSFVLIQAALVRSSDHSVRVRTSFHSPFRTAIFHRANQLDL
jgi:O-antigen ligase